MRKELSVFLLFVLFLEVNGVVQPPGAITITARTSTAVVFSFVSSSTGGATYEATFTSERSGIPQLGPISVTNTFYSASGLIPDVDYTLSIVAISDSERSTPVTVDVTTLPSIPNGPPQGVTQESSTSTSITLTWSDPVPEKINDRDGITGFRLFQGDQFVANVTTRRYQFTDLSPSREYTFKILAVNEQGPAPDRHAARFTGRTAPGVPAPPTFRVILPRFSLAYLIWSEPVPYVGEITKYDINYTVDGERLNVPQQSGTTRNYAINNINNHIGKTHAVSIRARTASGWGDFSEPVEFVFQPVVTVSIQPVDCSTVAVDYIIQPLPGEDNAAQLDLFVLEYHKTTGSSATFKLSEDISTNTSSGTVYVHNLEEDTFYDFSYNVDVTLTGIPVTPPGDFPADITYRIPNDCTATTTSVLSTTEVLPTTTTALPSTTTTPPSTTTAPPSTTTAPPTTTTAPPSTTTLPSSTTTAPSSTTTAPPSTTTTPPRTTTAPPTTTTAPPSTTTAPPSTTTLPSSTTTAPPSTTTTPPSTTTTPPSTTIAPPSTTTAPPSTTTAPPSTTTAPPSTTTAPPSTTTVPPSTTTVPPSTTTAPPSTTTVPPSTTTAPPSTTASLVSSELLRIPAETAVPWPTSTTWLPSSTKTAPPSTTTSLLSTTAATPTTKTAQPTTTVATSTTTATTPTTTSSTVDTGPSSSPTSGDNQCCVSTSIFAILFAVIIYLI